MPVVLKKVPAVSIVSEKVAIVLMVYTGLLFPKVSIVGVAHNYPNDIKIRSMDQVVR